MKKVLLFLASVLLFGCFEDRMLLDELTNRGSEFDPCFFKGERRFNGIVFDVYRNEQLKSEGNYKEGKKDGLTKRWYENGQLELEENYREGKEDGLCKRWYKKEKIQLELEENYTYGYRDGLCKRWYRNGQLRSEGNYTGLREYEDGSYDEYDVSALTAAKKDGLCKEWYENGQLKLEENFKEGTKDGLTKRWHENGQLELEINYKEGKKDGLCKVLTTKFGYVFKVVRDGNYKDGKFTGFCVEYDTRNISGKRGEFNYKDGVKHGLFKDYFVKEHDFKERVELEGNYKDGKLDGLCTSYFVDQSTYPHIIKKYEEKYYKDGIVIGYGYRYITKDYNLDQEKIWKKWQAEDRAN